MLLYYPDVSTQIMLQAGSEIAGNIGYTVQCRVIEVGEKRSTPLSKESPSLPAQCGNCQRSLDFAYPGKAIARCRAYRCNDTVEPTTAPGKTLESVESVLG